MDIGTTLILEMNNSYCTFDPVTGEERIFFACEIDVDAGYKFAEARFEIIIPENPAPAFFTLINVIEECEPFILERTDTDQFRVYDDEAPLRFCSIVNLKFWDDDLDALNPEVQEATDLSRPRMLADVEEVVRLLEGGTRDSLLSRLRRTTGSSLARKLVQPVIEEKTEEPISKARKVNLDD